MKSATLAIDKMSCQNCVNHVTQTLKGLKGVQIKQVQIGSAEVTFDPASASPQQLTSALTAAGYPARIAAIGK